MPKKRKSEATRLDDVDRSMYNTFCTTASSLTQLYTNAMHQVKLSHQAGERHALEKLYTWMLRQEEDGTRVTTSDICTYLQNELDYTVGEGSLSPRITNLQQQLQSQTLSHSSSDPSGPEIAGQGFRQGNIEQNGNSVFSNALSSPVRRSLQNYQSVQESPRVIVNNAARTNENLYNQTRGSYHTSTSDSSMDMHAYGPVHGSSY